jgi:hypothetical protein
MRVLTHLDEFTLYYMDKDDRFIVEMKQIRESDDANVTIAKYTLIDLVEYYQKGETITELIRTKIGGYIIINKKVNLLFIPLCNRRKNIVDYACSNLYNIEVLSVHTFCRIVADNRKYAQSNTTDQKMHELVFGRKAKKGYDIDHKDSIGLDNRKEKLRELTRAQNSANVNVPKLDGFRGVSWNAASEKWVAQIKHEKVRHYLGSFDDKVEAAKIRDVYAVHFAYGIKPLNKIGEKNILTDEEIADILKNGIPEKYKKKEVTKKLPTNISQSGAKSYNFSLKWKRYFQTENRCSTAIQNLQQNFAELGSLKKLKVKYDLNKGYYIELSVSKAYKSLQETENRLNLFKNYLVFLENEEKTALENDIDKYRNKDGVAILQSYDGPTDTYISVEIDDIDWKFYVHHYWYMDEGYPDNYNLGIFLFLNDSIRKLMIIKKIMKRLIT